MQSDVPLFQYQLLVKDDFFCAFKDQYGDLKLEGIAIHQGAYDVYAKSNGREGAYGHVIAYFVPIDGTDEYRLVAFAFPATGDNAD